MKNLYFELVLLRISKIWFMQTVEHYIIKLQQNLEIIFNTDHLLLHSVIYFIPWIILSITHSGIDKSYSSKLIMKLESCRNTSQMSKTVRWMLGVKYAQYYSWIIRTQSTPNFEILVILNNRILQNALFCKISRQNMWRSSIYPHFCDFQCFGVIKFGTVKKKTRPYT